MTTVELIQQARADADRYNEVSQALPLDDFIKASDEAAENGFIGLLTVPGVRHTEQTKLLYFYAFASHLFQHVEAKQPIDPRAKILGDLITPKQIWLIRSLAREAGVDAESECRTLFNCELESINKKAASALIDHLKREAGAASASVAPSCSLHR
jgi:hypothetical protein